MTAVWPGNPYPRGATWDGEGVNFSLFSENATKVELCLFDATGRRELQRIELNEYSDQIWHCYLPEARPGPAVRLPLPRALRSGARSPLQPQQAADRALCQAAGGAYALERCALRLCMPRIPSSTCHSTRRDSAPGTPKCRVIDPAFTWGDDRAPRTPWHDTVIYEVHVRGMTMRHPQVPPALRGTYAGLATRAGHRPPQAPRRHRGRVDAGACLPRRPPPGASRDCATTGATTPSASSPRKCATAPAARSRSSRPW